jgi:hypothetical protein
MKAQPTLDMKGHNDKLEHNKSRSDESLDSFAI